MAGFGRVALVYASFAPFHRARLAAAAAAAPGGLEDVTGIEIAGHQSDYVWPLPSEFNPRLITLFPRADYWSLSRRTLSDALWETLDSVDPAAVVLPGWAFRESITGLRWCIVRRRASVLLSDSQRIDTAQRPHRSLAKWLLVRQFDAAIAGGSPHRRYLSELGLPLDRCLTGCDVVDNSFFVRPGTAGVRRKRVSDGAPVMLSVLRLLPRKNVLAVLDALPRALQWRWVVAGDGPQRPLVERRISELGLGTRVDLLGHVPYDELPDLYASADVYLQPSLSEPWGLAVNEAMASGLPVVVSTRCGCSEDLVRDGENGYVFDPADRESLHRVLDLMLASRHRWPEMGLASRDIISDWGPDRFARNFWKACEIAIANRRLASSGPLRRLTGASLSLFA